MILGVEHAGPLFAESYRPAVLRAWLERVDPDGIAIERHPDAYAANDFYGFTVEIPDIVIPWAEANALPLHPFDWEPSREEQKLAFGFDLQETPFLRVRFLRGSWPAAAKPPRGEPRCAPAGAGGGGRRAARTGRREPRSHRAGAVPRVLGAVCRQRTEIGGPAFRNMNWNPESAPNARAAVRPASPRQVAGGFCMGMNMDGSPSDPYDSSGSTAGRNGVPS